MSLAFSFSSITLLTPITTATYSLYPTIIYPAILTLTKPAEFGEISPCSFKQTISPRREHV